MPRFTDFAPVCSTWIPDFHGALAKYGTGGLLAPDGDGFRLDCGGRDDRLDGDCDCDSDCVTNSDCDCESDFVSDGDCDCDLDSDGDCDLESDPDSDGDCD